MSRLLVLVPVVALLAGCGGDAPPPKTLAPVQLEVDAPQDTATVDQDTVEVHGRVAPASARVLVAGDNAGVEGGAFTAVVTLRPGANVIDIVAGAPRRAAAMTAVRVVREVPVQIPDVSGQKPSDAVRSLRALGLQPRVQESDSLLEQILPGDPAVCGTDPQAGQHVKAGATVTVHTAKSC